ncbi:MAG: ATP synthase F0 subunit B [Acidobacteria bacterium]|nr:ATP synthase F0 subunit B [Acidobacteriota bacterium]
MRSLTVILAGAGYLPIISKAINVTIFFGVLYLLLRKPLRRFFDERLARARADLERAAQEKAEVDTKMRELDMRLNRLDSELGEIRSVSEREAQAERERIERETGQAIEKIRTAAHREIDAAKQLAIFELREFAATKSVEMAERIIRQEITPEDDQRLIDRAAKALNYE